MTCPSGRPVPAPLAPDAQVRGRTGAASGRRTVDRPPTSGGGGRTRRLVTSLAGAALAALLVVPGSAAAAEERRVEGTVRVASTDAVAGARLAACAWRTGGEAAQGGTGWVLPVTPGATFGLSTSFTGIGPQPMLPRLRFYTEAPGCDHDGRLAALGTHGVVPAGATVAVVTASVAYAFSPGYPYWCLSPGSCFVAVLPLSFVYSETTGTASAPPPPVEPSVSVADVTVTADHRGRRTHLVTVTAAVVDSEGRPVPGATVGLRLTSAERTVYAGTATTDATGRAALTAEQNGGGHGTWTGCVTSVTAAHPHDAAGDTETCDHVAVS